MKQWFRMRQTSQQANRFLIGALLSTVFVIGSLAVWTWNNQPSHISVGGLGSEIVFSTKQRDVGAALREQGIELGPKDVVVPTLTTKIAPKSNLQVRVTRALPVSLTVDGKRHEVLTTAPTVGDLLKELSVAVAEKDRLSVDSTAPVVSNMEIKVIRRTEQIKTSQVEIPYNTVKREDQNLTLGETEEVQAGEPGILELTEVVYLEDGQVVGSELKQETVVKEPVERIVAYGTVGVVYRGGRNYRYTSELDMTATGYTAGKESNPNGTGHTYTGIKAVRGVVAVDPNVIPLNTRLYIEGYGPALAADIGGAIKGNKIDLCFDTVAEALEWGRRPVKVYILGD